VLISRLKVSGLLSFGPQGVDLSLEPLNVLIGPNGSGKSNLLEVFALLRASPRNLAEPIRKAGGIREWLWKGADSLHMGSVLASVVSPEPIQPLQHQIKIFENAEDLYVGEEHIRHGSHADYKMGIGNPALTNSSNEQRSLSPESLKRDESILSQVRDPENYPALQWLQVQYERIRLYRNWSFGPSAPLRYRQSAHNRSDVLTDGGENLALVLSNFPGVVKRELIDSLRKLYDGIVDIQYSTMNGNVQLLLEETDGREIPASRLSDGTLRYLSLLAILLHPNPPSLIAIEEPELGLHPDVMHHLADLLVRASKRMQLVVTTHDRLLVDALSDQPSSVVVCEKENGQSHFERLDAAGLKAWLDRYSLGQLWSKGEIGGNRW
jgi:predicted ATPase